MSKQGLPMRAGARGRGQATADTSLSEAFPFESNPNCQKVMRMFELFGNEYRFKILCLLSRGEACVQQIVERLGSKYSNISQQLKMLTLAGYLGKERRERQTFYRLESEEVRDVLRFFEGRYAVDGGEKR